MEWIITTPEMSHSGILGMHWGRRRYQNKDGSWTEAGKRRRREMSPDAKKRADRKNEIKNLKSKAELDTAKAAYKINKAQNKSAVQTAKKGVATISDKIKETAKKAAEAAKEKRSEKATEDVVRSGDLNAILKNKERLTEDELRTAVTRMRLEQDLKDVGAREKARGQEKFQKFANTVGNAANLTKSGIDIYNNMAKIMNTFTDKNMKIIGANSGESAYNQAMNEARLRTARAAATTAEVNARRARQSEVQERAQQVRDSRTNAAEGFRQFRENRRQTEERAHETYRNVSAQTRENIARAEQREAEGNARDAAIRELERTAPARANAGFHEFRAARRAAEEASSVRPSALPGPTMSAARTLVDNIIDREDDNN